MIKQIFILALVISLIVFVSGCTKQVQNVDNNSQNNISIPKKNLSEEAIDNQAIQEIEEEMDTALENMSFEDIEENIIK